MAQKADLRSAMLHSARTRGAANTDSAAVAEAPAAAAPAPATKTARPGREGKSNVTGYFPMNVKKQLRLMAAEQETTIQRLLAEALNDLFAKHGKPEIAPLDE